MYKFSLKHWWAQYAVNERMSIFTANLRGLCSHPHYVYSWDYICIEGKHILIYSYINDYQLIFRGFLFPCIIFYPQSFSSLKVYLKSLASMVRQYFIAAIGKTNNLNSFTLMNVSAKLIIWCQLYF